MKERLWFRLLYYWSYKKTPLGSGLTIPFLIGALNEYSDVKEKYSIDTLIKDFVSFEFKNYSISIRYCGTIGTLVCCLEELIEGELKGTVSIGHLNLFADSLSGKTNIDDLIAFLENEYNDLIKDSKYSFDNGAWHVFDKADKETIQLAVAKIV